MRLTVEGSLIKHQGYGALSRMPYHSDLRFRADHGPLTGCRGGRHHDGDWPREQIAEVARPRSRDAPFLRPNLTGSPDHLASWDRAPDSAVLSPSWYDPSREGWNMGGGCTHSARSAETDRTSPDTTGPGCRVGAVIRLRRSERPFGLTERRVWDSNPR
jgi:hypothetical protein